MHDVPTPVKHRSVSQLTSYSDCSERYRLERVVRAPQRQAGWTIQGLAVHKAVEVYELSRRTVSIAEAQEAFTDTWVRELSRAETKMADKSKWLRGGRKATERDLSDRYALGLQQVESYILDVQNGPFQIMDLPDGSPAVEVPFRISLDGVEVVGYIDQIVEDRNTGVPMVRDLKTGNEPVWPIQLGVYRLAMLDSLGIDIRWGDYYLSKKGGSSPPVDLHKFGRNQVANWFAKLDKGIREEIFLPNPGNCFTCGVRDHCPVYVT